MPPGFEPYASSLSNAFAEGRQKVWVEHAHKFPNELIPTYPSGSWQLPTCRVQGRDANFPTCQSGECKGGCHLPGGWVGTRSQISSAPLTTPLACGPPHRAQADASTVRQPDRCPGAAAPSGVGVQPFGPDPTQLRLGSPGSSGGRCAPFPFSK